MTNFCILAGAIVIAAKIAIFGRYSIAAGGSDATDGAIVWRVDHWTGNLSRCQSVPLFCQKVAY
jgi:hypothetical protein